MRFAAMRLFNSWCRDFGNGNILETHAGKGGWWATLSRPGWRMDRGPYPLEALARLAFPVQRLTWRGGP